MIDKKRYFSLIESLNHMSPATRMKAIEALSASDDPRIAGPLTRRLFDAEPEVRANAAAALTRVGLDSLGRAIVALYSRGADARSEAISTIRPLILAAMPGPHVAAIATTAAGLHELYDEVAAIGVMHEDKYVRRAAIEGLYQVNQPALAPVFLLPSVDTDAGVRRYAAVGLAENAILTGSGRLCRDRDKTVAEAARSAYAHPGEPALVRDPHRRVMDKSTSFRLPECGGCLLSYTRFKHLRGAAIGKLASSDPLVAEYAVLALLGLGMARQDVFQLLPDAPGPRIRARLASPAAQEAVGEGVEPDPTFVGRRVLVAGGDGVETHLVAALEARGLQVLWLSGFDNAASRKSDASFDVVLILTRRISHAVAEHAVRIGEACQAIVLHVHSVGQDSVLDAVREALE